MRAIVVHPGPHFSTADVYRGWVAGLRANGVDVREFNLGDRLNCYLNAHFYDEGGDTFHRMWPDEGDVARLVGHDLHSACYQFDPDVVVVISAAWIPTYVYDICRERGTRVVLIHTESPYEDEVQLTRGTHADLNVVNDPTNLDDWNDHTPTIYLPHAYDPAVHRPGPSSYRLDIGWVGTAGDEFPSRTQFMEKVDALLDPTLRVAMAGMFRGDEQSPLWPLVLDGMHLCVTNDVTIDIYRGSTVSFNLYRSDGTDGSYTGGWAMGPREVELAAVGCFYARHSPPDHGGEGDQVLSMLPTFTEPGELDEILRHYLAHDGQRDRLATQAAAAIADRTFEHHAAELLRRVDS